MAINIIWHNFTLTVLPSDEVLLVQWESDRHNDEGKTRVWIDGIPAEMENDAIMDATEGANFSPQEIFRDLASGWEIPDQPKEGE